MKDPFGLEPADGDYVAYIEKLQAGKIRNLDPLKTAASSPAATNPVPPGTPESTAEAAEERERSVMAELAKIGIPVPSPIPEPPSSTPSPMDAGPAGETPSERLRRRAREANARNAARAFSGLISFVSFGLIVLGIILETPWLTVVGIILTLFTFNLAANGRKK